MNQVKTKSCQQILDQLPEYVQNSLEPEETAFIREHLEDCAHCSFEYELMSNLNGLAVDKPLIPLDDLSKRRLVSEVVDSYDHQPRINKKSSWSWRLVLSGAGAMVAVVMVLAGYLLLHRADAPNRKGRVTYVAGRAKLSGKELNPSAKPAVGDKIATRKGEVIYHLPGGTSILQKPGSFVQINTLSANRTALFLVQGSIFVAVKRQSGDPLVEIATPRGTVLVTGTSFHLEVVKNSVVVRMFKGQVQVSTDNGKFQVAGGQSFNLAASAPEKLSGQAAAKLKSNFDRLDYFDSGDKNANLIMVNSKPSRAKLQINGIDFGRTPVFFRSPAKKLQLQVAHQGFEPFKQSIVLQTRENRQIFASLNRKQTLPVASNNNNSQGELAKGDESRENGASEKQGDQKVATDNSGQEKEDSTLGKVKSSTSSSQKDSSQQKSGKKLNEYMSAARKLARENKWRQVATQYRRILKLFPSSSSRYTIMIELGEIELDRLGNPSRARSYFQQYINSRKGGALLQEARWGKIRALGRLGKIKQEIIALKAFIADYPASYQNKKARRRLKKISPPAPSSPKGRDTSTSSPSPETDKTKK